MEPLPDSEVDARGLLCPLPILRLARAMRRAPRGAVLGLLATDPAAVGDVEAFCREGGHALLSTEREESLFRFRVRKG
ncbi:MAG TPA: sulfurtransferase TusA family protein [Thermoanaerobaculia bacterium]|nr:sulfurtransferase TusA family protein [Thermoanaerobaculia bacterium]